MTDGSAPTSKIVATRGLTRSFAIAMRLLFLVILALSVPAPLQAEDEPAHALRVVNDTSSAVNQLFVSGGKPGKLRAKVNGIFGASDDERDRLDTKMLPRGGSIVVALKGARCRYDLRAVLEDGRTYTADDYDICTSGQWAISSGTRR